MGPISQRELYPHNQNDPEHPEVVKSTQAQARFLSAELLRGDTPAEKASILD